MLNCLERTDKSFLFVFWRVKEVGGGDLNFCFDYYFILINFAYMTTGFDDIKLQNKLKFFNICDANLGES